MGYYVKITSSTAKIPAANLKTAYEKMCALNVTHDHKKRGGSWSGGKEEARWFSWMDANYPETCKDAQEILEQLGFETFYDNNGDLVIDYYDSKTGEEDLFMGAIENLTTGRITWVGEDGSTWTTIFAGDDVLEMEPTTKLLGFK